VRAASGAVRSVPLLCLCLCLCLTGCTNLFHSNARPEQIYYLRAPSSSVAPLSSTRMAVSLRVVRPTAGPGLDSPHIMLVQADHRMNYYSGSRWPATLPDVVGALTVERLRASGAWASVEDSASAFPSDYLLQLNVRRFEADYTASAAVPVVEVAIDCTLGRREGRDVIATFTATGSAPAAANRLTEVVSAFEQAVNAALASLAEQVAQAVAADVQHVAQKVENPEPSSNRPSQ
jgi:cholesterol transport system auxiliary component